MAAMNERSGPDTPGRLAARPGGRARGYMALARPSQWVKNGFVALPLALTPGALVAPEIGRAALAVAAFCLVASAGYVVNDLADREADRAHPLKRWRPLAAGLIGTGEAAALAAALLLAGLAAAWAVSATLVMFVAAYLALSLSYSFALKHVAIVDVLVIAAGFVMRVEAGSAAIAARPSVWIVVCTGLLALFLALAKRRDDLVIELGAGHRRSLAGYNKAFVDASLVVVIAAAFVSYVIYTADAEVMARLGSRHLYLTVPFVLAGILRYLQIVLVEERSGSPTTILLTDRFTGAAVLGWLACFMALIHL
jgi:4-hydroxybenzoate polyprenyltransferase